MYLVDLPNREPEGVRRLLGIPGLSAKLFSRLGLVPGFTWYLLEVRMNRLCDLDGDVDILAGHLSWREPSLFQSFVSEEAKATPDHHPSWHANNAALRLAASGGLTWPPPLDYLIGVEAKCAYLSRDATQISENTIKSKKSSEGKIKGQRNQIDKLCNMGLNKLALLDIIATPPASGNGIHAWFNASSIAIESFEAMKPTLNKRLPPESVAGHWVWPIGSVDGGDESWRGAGAPLELQVAQDNPLLQDQEILKRRDTVREKLRDIFRSLPSPQSLPVIFVYCLSCGRIHSLAECSSH